MVVKGKIPVADPDGNILLIQLGDIGDVVLTMPAIRALKERFPDSGLFVCVREKAADLIQDCPWAEGVIAVDKRERSFLRNIGYQFHFFRQLRKKRFSWAIELRTGNRGTVIALLSGAGVRIGRYIRRHPWRNRVFTHQVEPGDETGQYVAQHCLNILSPFGVISRDHRPVLSVPSYRKAAAGRLLRKIGAADERLRVAFHPFSLWRYKELPVETCAALVEYLTRQQGCTVVLTGAPEERKRAGEVAVKASDVYNLAGRTAIGEMPALLSACHLFIGVDTAALHIAAAVGTPTVGIFGPSSPVSWAPRGQDHRIVSKAMDCVPCRNKGCEGTEQSRCIETLSLEEIRAVVDAQLDRIRDRNFLTDGS